MSPEPGMPSVILVTPVPSPCIGICCVGGDGLCFGCFRDRVELSGRGKATEAEKLEILERCRLRQQQAP